MPNILLPLSFFLFPVSTLRVLRASVVKKNFEKRLDVITLKRYALNMSGKTNMRLT